MQMGGMLLVRPGHAWCCTSPMRTAVLVCNVMISLRMPPFILLLHVSWLGVVLSLRKRQDLWLPKDDLKDASSWSSTPLLLLRDIHNDLVTRYECKDSAPPPAQPGVRRASPGRASQNGVSQQQAATPLFIPQLHNLSNQANLRGEDASETVPPSLVISDSHT